MYDLIIYSDFYADFEKIKTDIPENVIKDFLYIYCNLDIIKIDFDKMIQNLDFNFDIVSCGDSVLFKEDLEKNIRQENIYFLSDFLMEV